MQNLGLREFFGRNWERLLIWGLLIAFLFLLRPFFLLIFETFLITYIAKGIVGRVVERTKLGYTLTTILVFALLVGMLVALGHWIAPKLLSEMNQIVGEFAGDGKLQGEKMDRFIENTVRKIVGPERGQTFIGSQQYADLRDMLKAEGSKGVKMALPQVLQLLVHFVKMLWEMLIYLILAIIFSFILVKDWLKISTRMKALEQSRIRTFYQAVAPHLVAFAEVLGKALRAQAIIAACNTLLTVVGLWAFEVPNIALLSTIVFFCGFIPILGTFLSSIPIVIFGLQVGGLPLVLKLILFVMAIHAFEAYVLNPKITADVLHFHPILVLVILLVGERFFGIWGMVVGVPVGYYILKVITRRDDGLPSDADGEMMKKLETK